MIPVEDAPGDFGLAVTNPGGKLWGVVVWDGRTAVEQTHPHIPFGGAQP